MNQTGEHQFRVFDDETEALLYAALVKRGGRCKVFFWEM